MLNMTCSTLKEFTHQKPLMIILVGRTVELSRRSVARDLPFSAKAVTCVTVGFCDLLGFKFNLANQLKFAYPFP